MSSRIEKHLAQSRTRFSGSSTQTEAGSARHCEVNVIFTTCEPSRHALRAAANLARDLGVRLKFIVLRTVPYAFPLTQPPVSVAFIEQRFAAMVKHAEEKSEIDVLICNCRSLRPALAKILRPHSLVVIGGNKQWWPTEAARLAGNLRSKGHEVIFVGSQEGSHAGSFLPVHWRAVFCRLLGLHPGL